jgi:transposase
VDCTLLLLVPLCRSGQSTARCQIKLVGRAPEELLIAAGGSARSPSRLGRPTTIGFVRFFLARRSDQRCYSRIVDMTRTGSASLPANKEHGRTSCKKTKSHRPDLFQPVHRARNLIERFFNKIKQCRRVATRYDKLAANCLAFIKLASIRIWRALMSPRPGRIAGNSSLLETILPKSHSASGGASAM